MNSTIREESEFERQYLSDLTGITVKENSIEPSLYNRYSVKRGLRNADGTGVLVGLTNLGDVHGYVLDEGEKTPVEGHLRYRGIDVEDIVKGFQKEKRFGYNEVAYLLLFGNLPNARQVTQ